VTVSLLLLSVPRSLLSIAVLSPVLPLSLCLL